MGAEPEPISSGGPKRVFEAWKVVVMGGSRGIGRAVTLGFAEGGANVAACGRSPDALDALDRDMGHAGRTTYMAAFDVGDARAVSTFVPDAAAALGGIDVLVNCASAMMAGSDDGVWSASFNIDLLGSVHATDAALPFLKKSAHASIVNMASVGALKPTPARPAYGAIKAAVMHFTASSALALAADGIRVNCVVPGSTEQPGGVWAQIAQSNPDLYRDTRASIPFGRLATPEDIARVVLFLASPDAAWITGQSIVVDGGQSLSRPGA